MPIVVKPYSALLASAFGDSFKRAFGESFDFARKLGLINQLLGEGFKAPDLYHPDERPTQKTAPTSTMPYGGGTFGAKLDQRFQDVIRDAVGLPPEASSLEPRLNLSPISEAIKRSRETAPFLERLLPGTSRYLIEQEGVPTLPRIKSFHEWYNEYLQANWPTIKNMLALGYNPAWIVDKAVEGYNKAFEEYTALQNELLKQRQREEELAMKEQEFNMQMRGAKAWVKTAAEQYGKKLDDESIENLAIAIVTGKVKAEDIEEVLEGKWELKLIEGMDGRVHVFGHSPRTGEWKRIDIPPDLKLISQIEQIKERAKGGGRGVSGKKEQKWVFRTVEVPVDKAAELGWVNKNEVERMKIRGKYTAKVPAFVSKDGREVSYIRPEEFEDYQGQQQKQQSSGVDAKGATGIIRGQQPPSGRATQSQQQSSQSEARKAIEIIKGGGQ